MSNTLPAHEILERLFQIVVDEAKKRPDFAEALVKALPNAVVARIEKPTATKAAPKFDPTSIPATTVLRQHGEATLRARLAEIRTKKDLMAVAKASGVQLSDKARAKGASVADIVDGIVAGAKHYIKYTAATAAA